MCRRSYNDLKRGHKGRLQNVANVMNRVKANIIPNPPGVSLQQSSGGGVDYYKIQMHKMRLKYRGLRRVYLRDKLIWAQEIGNKEGVKDVQQVIYCKENSRMWYFINGMTDNPKSRGMLKVECYVSNQHDINIEQ